MVLWEKQEIMWGSCRTAKKKKKNGFGNNMTGYHCRMEQNDKKVTSFPPLSLDKTTSFLCTNDNHRCHLMHWFARILEGRAHMCREGAAHFKSQSDANAVLHHSFSATDADAAAFSSAGTNAQKHVLVLLPLWGHLLTYILTLLPLKSHLWFHVRSTRRPRRSVLLYFVDFWPSVQICTAQKHIWIQICPLVKLCLWGLSTITKFWTFEKCLKHNARTHTDIRN